MTRYLFNLFSVGPVNYVRHHQKYESTVNPVFLSEVCCDNEKYVKVHEQEIQVDLERQ